MVWKTNQHKSRIENMGVPIMDDHSNYIKKIYLKHDDSPIKEESTGAQLYAIEAMLEGTRAANEEHVEFVRWIISEKMGLDDHGHLALAQEFDEKVLKPREAANES